MISTQIWENKHNTEKRDCIYVSTRIMYVVSVSLSLSVCVYIYIYICLCLRRMERHTKLMDPDSNFPVLMDVIIFGECTTTR